MKVIVTCERRFMMSPDGVVWTTSTDAFEFWERYLAVFDSVAVLSRVRPVSTKQPTWRPVCGPAVRVLPIQDDSPGVGKIAYALSANRACRAALTEDAAVILRTPGLVSLVLDRRLRRDGRPYAVEVTGDPAELFGRTGLHGFKSSLLRPILVRALRRQCRNAVAAAYVTSRTLQARYPPGPAALVVPYSSVMLPPEAFAPAPRSGFVAQDGVTLISVGSMERNHKGIDVLIRAVNAVRSSGLPIRLLVVGGGRYLGRLRALAARLRVPVQFTGEVPGPEAVRVMLRNADVFVLSSRSEGLPRALLEAMAQALPCIATSVGGVPEVLPEEALAPPGDVLRLADRISQLCRNPQRLAEMSRSNLETAKAFRDDVLAERRRSVYARLADATARHFQDRARACETSGRCFVYSDGILGVQTDLQSFRWPYGAAAPVADADGFSRCRLRFRVRRKSSRYFRDRLFVLAHSPGATRYNQFFAAFGGDDLIYSRRLAPGIRIYLRCYGIHSGVPGIDVSHAYLRLVRFRFMNLHALAYVLADLAGLLLLRVGLAPLHCSAVRVSGRAIAIFGPSNTGKTLTAISLCKTLGADLISEDIAITDGRRIFGVPWTNTFKYYPQLSTGLFPQVAARLRLAVPLLDLLPGLHNTNARDLGLSPVSDSTEISHVVVLEPGEVAVIQAPPVELMPKLLNLNRAEFRYSSSPLNNAYEYFHPEIDLPGCIERERTIILTLCTMARARFVVRAPRAEQFAQLIVETLHGRQEL